MATPTKARQLGKNFRVFIGNTATPANNTAFTKITNENAWTLKGAADVQEDETKEAGLERSPGTVSWELSGDFNEIYVDTGLATLVEDALNTPWAFQIRDTSAGTDTVWMEGEFLLSDLEWKTEVKGVRSGTFTLKSSGAVKRNNPTRALTTA